MGNVEQKELQPHSIEAEEALLGSIIIDQDVIYRVRNLVQQADFWDERHQWIYWAMRHLTDNGMPTDFVSLCDILERKGRLQQITAAYIAGLIAIVPFSGHAEYYARTVADYASRRRLLQVAGDIAKRACDLDSPDPISFAHQAVLHLNGRDNGDLAHVNGAASSLYDQIEAWAKTPLPFGDVRGLSAGIPSIDYLTNGMQRKDLIVIAGRPQTGKSALSFDIGLNVAEEGKRVAIFSLEMSKEKVLSRWASRKSGIDNRRVERGLCPEQYCGTRHERDYYVSGDALAAYLKAIAEVSGISHLYVDDTPGLSVSEIRGRCLGLAHRLGGLDLVIVDHGGLVRSEPLAGENSAKTEGRKSQMLKALAKELNCVSLLLLQLNRGVESRSDKRPVLSDFRDSGEHEQNVDIALGLYWEAYYNDGIKQVMSDGTPNPKWLELEVLLLKHRDGAPDRRRILRYERHLSRFTEWQRGGG